jgi:hypothetical protein
VVERKGAIRVVHDRHRLPTPFLDRSGRVSTGEEPGLLPMAVAPDYQASGRFSVDYTDRAGDMRIVEYLAGRAGLPPGRRLRWPEPAAGRTVGY